MTAEGLDLATENAAVLRRGMDAFVHRDVAGLQAALHPDIVWHDQGQNRISGDYRGVGEVLDFLGRTFTIAGDSLRIEPVAALTGDGFVAAVIDLTAARGQRSINDRSIFLARIQDGSIIEVWAYAWNPYALDAFWGPPSP